MRLQVLTAEIRGTLEQGRGESLPLQLCTFGAAGLSAASAPHMATFIPNGGLGSIGETAESSEIPSPLILIVEDHEDTRLMLRTLLEMQGVRVVEACDGKSGVSAAEELQPDLILMDVTLPTVDGLAATRLIREHKTLCRVPVVITSGHASAQAQQAAFAAGCTDYLVKPIDFDQLDSILRKYLSSKSVDASGDAGSPRRTTE